MISIHDIHADIDGRDTMEFEEHEVFQSTISMQISTIHGRALFNLDIYFNPRYPCRYRLYKNRDYMCNIVFQSTISMQISTKFNFVAPRLLEFQSTISMQISTCDKPVYAGNRRISIHDIHADIDCVQLPDVLPSISFQSTISMQISTDEKNGKYSTYDISIHDIHADIDSYASKGWYELSISIHDIHADIDQVKGGKLND